MIYFCGQSLLEIITSKEFILEKRQFFLHYFNLFFKNAKKKVRKAVYRDWKIQLYIPLLLEYLKVCGDFETQGCILTTLLWLRFENREMFSAILPNHQLQQLFNNITDIDPDSRVFLNHFNKEQEEQLVYTFTAL